MFRIAVEGTPSYERYSPGDDHPVVNVDWYDAWAYAKWAGLRLPTGSGDSGAVGGVS